MKITLTRDENKDVIKIYLPDTRKRTEEQIIKRIPVVMNELREVNKIKSKVKKFLNKNN